MDLSEGGAQVDISPFFLGSISSTDPSGFFEMTMVELLFACID
jgi:hypothetical protein